MTESGQPGAPTPGDHGDGTDPQDDLAHSVSGWPPPGVDWSRGREAGRDPGPVWRQPDSRTGWPASAPWRSDLPAAPPGLPVEEPSGRVNGRAQINGVHRAEEEPSLPRQAPVSAPPLDEPFRHTEADRLAVPAQRPEPPGDQPSVEAEPVPPGHTAAGPPPTGREGNLPSSAPPAGQAPPIGTAASGFDVPRGFHTPTADRAAAPPPGGWADRHPSQPSPGPVEERRAAAAEQPEWSGPNWNRPSWGEARAPQWSRGEEPVGRRAREERPVEWAPEQAAPHEPARAEPARPPESGYGSPQPEPARPYEPVRTYAAPASAPPAGYDPPPAAEDSIEERGGVPYRPRRVVGEIPPMPPAEVAGHSPADFGPALAPATSGRAHYDHPPAPAQTGAPPYAARRSAPEPVSAVEPVADTGSVERGVLPQRVPAEPDVPVVPEPPAVEPSAETPELARIATHLRRDDEPAPLRERPEGFDVDAILAAVREVAGVRDALLRRTPAGAHSLRLDLADGADPAEVSRQVARLLQERMGLAAAPQNLPGTPATPPPVRRRSTDAGAEPTTTESLPAEGPVAAVPPAAGRAAEPPGEESGSTEGRRSEGRADRPGPERPEPPSGSATETEPPRRRRQATHRGRAAVEEPSLAVAPAGTPAVSPSTVGTSYSGGQLTTTEIAPSRPLNTGSVPGPRVVIDHVQVSTFGLDATVEVRLVAGREKAEGHSTGPAVDGYLLRLCASAAAAALDELLRGPARSAERGRCFVEHAAVVPFGTCEVATVVVLLVCDGWVEQLAGSALVAGDPRRAVVRATLAAVNRRLEALLA